MHKINSDVNLRTMLLEFEGEKRDRKAGGLGCCLLVGRGRGDTEEKESLLD